MIAHRRTAILTTLCLAATVLAVACAKQQKSGNGQLAVALTDAPAPEVQEIWVNVTSVRAHVEGSGWATVSTTPVTVDLLKLQGAVQQLGLVSLPPGTITQIRLVVAPDGNTVTVAGASLPLKVPSGSQSGIKINGPWTIDACTQTAITLDFDGHRSIWTHPTGSGDEWILRPVIRTKKVETTDTTCGDGGGTCDPKACASGACDATGVCAPGGPGTPCTTTTECLSGVCTEGTCAVSPPGGPCRLDADCAEGTCGTDGTCATTPSGPAPTGSPCTDNTACVSNACVEGSCAPGGPGLPCTGDMDCETGLFCTAGVCAAAPANPL